MLVTFTAIVLYLIQLCTDLSLSLSLCLYLYVSLSVSVSLSVCLCLSLPCCLDEWPSPGPTFDANVLFVLVLPLFPSAHSLIQDFSLDGPAQRPHESASRHLSF